MPGPKRQDLTGRRFGRLVAVREGKIVRRQYPSGQKRQVYWVCVCDCGKGTETPADNLRKGKSKSCGCLHRERVGDRVRTHGMRHTPEYTTWAHIIGRCGNPNHISFANYGGRGVQCKFKTFEEFVGHVGRRPSKKHSIDRINNDGHYEPGNVRWAVKTTQVRNRRKTVMLCYMGSDRPLAEWADILCVNYKTLHKRRKQGWSPEEILFGK